MKTRLRVLIVNLIILTCFTIIARFYQREKKWFHRLITNLLCLCSFAHVRSGHTGVRRQVLESSTYCTATKDEQAS